ncbi:MAG: hypothetical protein WBL56_10290 [Candidatus Acidiferrum sp.]
MILGVACGPLSDIHGMATDRQDTKPPHHLLERTEPIESMDYTFHRHSMVWRKNYPYGRIGLSFRR